MMKLKQQKAAGLFLLVGIVTVLAFQNCAPGFNTSDLGGSSLSSLKFDGAYSAETISAGTNVVDGDIQCLDARDYSFTMSSKLKYFGMISVLGSGLRDFATWKSTTEKTLKMGNIQFLQVSFYESDDRTALELRKRLDFLYGYKQNIGLAVSEVFFENGHLRQDYAQRWLKVVNILKSYDTSKIVLVYPYDEPFWNAKNNGISPTLMASYLKFAGTAIKAQLPSSALLLVEAYPMIDSSFVIPEIFDWIAVDCYFEACLGKTIQEYYSILSSKLYSHQKFAAIPPAVALKSVSSFTRADSVKLKDQFVSYAKWFATEPRIVASLSFLYSYKNDDGSSSEDLVGAEHSCESSDIHRIYWKKLQAYLAVNIPQTAPADPVVKAPVVVTPSPIPVATPAPTVTPIVLPSRCQINMTPNKASITPDEIVTVNVSSSNASQVQVNCGSTWNSFANINGANTYPPNTFVQTQYVCRFRALNSAGNATDCSPASVTVNVKQKVTCGSGTMTLPSASGGAACSMSWPQATEGTSSYGSASNGGWIRATCGSDTEWKNIQWSCP